MDERDLEPEHAAARLLVDQLGAARREIANRGADVVHLVGDVMDAGAAVGEELPHRRVVAQWMEQLDAAAADEDGCSLEALVLDEDAMLDPAAEEALVRGHGLVEVGDGQPDVMDPACLHGGDRM